MPRAAEVIVDIGVDGLWGGIESALAVHRLMRADVDELLRRKEYGVLCGATALVFGPRWSDGSPSDLAVEQLRSAAPHVGVYVVASSTAELGLPVKPFAWAGVDDVLTLSSSSDFRAIAPGTHAVCDILRRRRDRYQELAPGDRGRYARA